MSDKKKPTAFANLCHCITMLARRVVDGSEFHSARLAAIEDRLAALDGGDDAAAARRAALFNTNANRVSAGREMLSIKIDNATGKAVWTK